MADIPRRSRLDLMVPAEMMIRRAVMEIENLGADVRLTAAQKLLTEAQNLVADYIDDHPNQRPPSSH